MIRRTRYERTGSIALRLCTAHGEDRSGASTTAHRRAEKPPRASLRLGTAGVRPGRPGQAGRALGPGRVDPVDRSSGRSPRRRGPRDRPASPVAINPAASILPIVEKVAPERLEEVFWKAVALMPKNDAQSGIFLARYDRQVADVFVTQAVTYRPRSLASTSVMVGAGQGECRSSRRRGDDRSTASRQLRSAVRRMFP